jgi:hypothetical protein
MKAEWGDDDMRHFAAAESPFTATQMQVIRATIESRFVAVK